MKLIILAGGYGSRLGNLTEAMPKPMIRVGGIPLIIHIIRNYASFGINDFIISAGYKADVIKEYFYNYTIYKNDFSINLKSKDVNIHSTGNDDDWNVTVVNTGLNTLKGARIKRLEKYLDDDINMITYGDGLANVNISELLNFHKSHNKILTITGVKPPSRFGEIIHTNGLVQSFTEKPQTSVGLINGGYMVFNKSLLDYLTEDELCDFEIGALQQLTAMNEVMVYEHKGLWECIDTERDLIHLNKLWNAGNAFWKTWK